MSLTPQRWAIPCHLCGDHTVPGGYLEAPRCRQAERAREKPGQELFLFPREETGETVEQVSAQLT